MRHHPLTPMTDSNLVRVLGRQTPSRVGLVDLATVEAGAAAVARGFNDLVSSGHRMAIVDALFDRHLDTIAHASAGLRLVTGGAALGGALARTNRARTDAPHGERAKEPHDCDEGPAWKQFQAGFLLRLTSAEPAGIWCRRRRAAASAWCPDR